MNTNSEHPPSSIIKSMYLEITNIAQGVNLAVLVYILATGDFWNSLKASYFSTPFLAATSFLIVVIFWIRYYLDTEILNRSFTTMSALWFFAYETVQGVSIGFITSPARWLGATGLFLLFGAGFYWLNLKEIRRKSGILTVSSAFVRWQKVRLIELGIISLMTLTGAFLVARYPALATLAGVFAFAIAIWQTSITHDYSKLGFINMGL